MQILWTQQALTDLKAIKAYLSYKTSYLVIEKFLKKLIQKTEILADSPYLGRIVPEYDSPNLRELIEEKYRIIYRIDQHVIYILTVFEGHKLLVEDHWAVTIED